MKSAAQILRDARALIDTPDKWWRGWGTATQTGQYCVSNAVSFAASCSSGKAHKYLFLAVTGDEYNAHGTFRWNDAPDRTHAEVMGAFDKAIALAEKDELPKRERETDTDYTARVLAEITKGVGGGTPSQMSHSQSVPNAV